MRQQSAKNIRHISNLLKTFKVRTLLNSNSNFVTSLANTEITSAFWWRRNYGCSEFYARHGYC